MRIFPARIQDEDGRLAPLRKQVTALQTELTAAQAKIVALTEEVSRLEIWQQQAFAAHPNIDLDIDSAARMVKGFNVLQPPSNPPLHDGSGE